MISIYNFILHRSGVKIYPLEKDGYGSIISYVMLRPIPLDYSDFHWRVHWIVLCNFSWYFPISITSHILWWLQPLISKTLFNHSFSFVPWPITNSCQKQYFLKDKRVNNISRSSEVVQFISCVRKYNCLKFT